MSRKLLVWDSEPEIFQVGKRVDDVVKDLGRGNWNEEGLEGERLPVPQVQVTDHNQELLHHNTLAEVKDLQTK